MNKSKKTGYKKRKLTQILFLVLLFFYSTSFSNDENKRYVNGDFSFTIPKGWKIKTEKITPDTWQYVSCSKKGLGASGIVMIKWIKDSLNLEEVLKLQVNEYNNKFGLTNGGEIQVASFNSQRALKANQRFSVLNIDHSSEFYCFYLCGYTVFFIVQGADEDINVNSKGFELIKSSFYCSVNLK